MRSKTRCGTETAVDLFAGCGGLSLGLRKAGFHVLGAIELCELAVETYKMNHPEPLVYHNDIQDVSALGFKRQLGLRKGELDLLAGCPPCQGFSTVRTLNGSRRVQDPRNDLLFEFLRFVEAFAPRAVMLENVPGLLSNYRMKRFLSRLRGLGYYVNSDILDASDYGVPQRRRRLIILASVNAAIGFPSAARKPRTVRDAIGSLKPVGESGDPLHDLPEERSPRVRSLIRSIPKDGGSRKDAAHRFQLACHKKCNGFKDVYGRMAWDEAAPTITGGCVNPSKGRFLHPEEDRCITLREAALLQTFPKRYRFSLRRGKFPAAEMIGNALPPEFVRRQALAVLKHLDSEAH
ncbi:DNA cytosine methyltransferase [bacterium]|nr:MAG: DNA cytosine methyltransferase [bacterium]